MPRLMEKRDWMQTVADVGSAEIMKELREGEE